MSAITVYSSIVGLSAVHTDISTPITIDSPYLTLTAQEVANMSKMAIGVHVMQNIYADDSVAENQRTTLFKPIMMSLGASASGCYTYARNIRRHLQGMDLYASNKKWNAKRTAEKQAKRQLAEEAVPLTDIRND